MFCASQCESKFYDFGNPNCANAPLMLSSILESDFASESLEMAASVL